MSNFILHIDTASARGLVMISENGQPLAVETNLNPHSHASFVQPAIKDMLKKTGLDGRHFRCVAVANGPGSYTGLRVGLAAAKGLCYAWNLPLCTVSSLKILAASALDLVEKYPEPLPETFYLAPMIDARRMEVFYALYRNTDMAELITPSALVLDESSLGMWLADYVVFFTGDGAIKWQPLCRSANARFLNFAETEKAFARLAWQESLANRFADIAYAEPFYAKEFYSPHFVKKG